MVSASDNEFYTDMNGVPQPRKSLYEQQYTEEQLRSMKQKFLMENVINCGYDPTEFAQFMEYQKGRIFLITILFDLLSSLVHRGWHKCRQLGV